MSSFSSWCFYAEVLFLGKPFTGNHIPPKGPIVQMLTAQPCSSALVSYSSAPAGSLIYSPFDPIRLGTALRSKTHISFEQPHFSKWQVVMIAFWYCL
jgi:hypothetical protein